MTKSPWHRLQGHVGPRDFDRYPNGDEDLGRQLFSAVCKALLRGRPAPVAFVVYSDSIERFSLKPVADKPANLQRRLLSAMAGQPDVECVAVLGAFRFRGRGAMNGQLVASVFVEWPDNRWWTAWQPIGPNRSLIGAAPQIRTAMDGSPRPGGVGGWFALSRRLGLRLRVHRDPTPVH